MFKKFGVSAAAIMLCLSGQAAHAGLSGDTVNGSYYFPDLSSVYQDGGNKAVSPSASFLFLTGVPNVTTTVTDTQIIMTFDATGAYNPAAFSGVVVTDLTSASISGVTIDAATDLPGFNASDIAFTANSVEINIQGLSIIESRDIHNQIVLDVAVPEPVSMTVLGAGLVGLGLARRRRA